MGLLRILPFATVEPETAAPILKICAEQRAGYKNLGTSENAISTNGTAMSRIFHPRLYLLACATRQERARQVQYLKTENEILRARLPKKITTK